MNKIDLNREIIRLYMILITNGYNKEVISQLIKLKKVVSEL